MGALIILIRSWRSGGNPGSDRSRPSVPTQGVRTLSSPPSASHACVRMGRPMLSRPRRVRSDSVLGLRWMGSR